MRAFIVTTLVLGVSLSACTKKSGQERDEQRPQTERALERASTESEREVSPVKGWTEARAREELDLLSVEQVLARQEAGEDILFVDVNNLDVRTREGVLPDALLLSHPRDIASLPDDKRMTLVFYGENPQSAAAGAATAAAQTVGYGRSFLMIDGIVGWRAASQPTSDYRKTAADAIAPQTPVTSVRALRAGIDEGSMQAVDANSQATRDEFGVIPDAILLSGGTYEVVELPQDLDTHLVFYCSSPACTAAPHAALRASEHGYRNVSILSAGIRGWLADEGYVQSTD